MVALITLFFSFSIFYHPSPSPEPETLYYPPLEPEGFVESSNLMQEAQDYNSFWIETAEYNYDTWGEKSV